MGDPYVITSPTFNKGPMYVYSLSCWIVTPVQRIVLLCTQPYTHSHSHTLAHTHVCNTKYATKPVCPTDKKPILHTKRVTNRTINNNVWQRWVYVGNLTLYNSNQLDTSGWFDQDEFRWRLVSLVEMRPLYKRLPTSIELIDNNKVSRELDSSNTD
jgi:hypothetical protein